MRLRAGRHAPASPHEKLAFIEGMRGVAALYVVLGHFWNMVDPAALWNKSISPPWLQVAMAPFHNGHLAVAAFIVISGFCLQLSLFGNRDGHLHDKKRFFARRAWRILPAYYACLAVSVVVALTVSAGQTTAPFTEYVPVTWQNVSAHLLMVHNLSADWMYKLNGVLWSIAIEVQLYLLFPLLVASLFKVGRVAVVAFAAALAAALLHFVPESLKLYPWYLPLFALGMASAHLAYRPNRLVGVVPGFGVFMLGASVVACVASCATRQSMILSDVLIGIAAASLMYTGAISPESYVPSRFAVAPLVALGGFSYSLYLMHHPIQQVLYVYRPSFVVGPVLEAGYLLFVGLPVILGIAYLFSLLFERPFLHRKARQKPAEGLPAFTPVALPLRAYAASTSVPAATPMARTAVVAAPAGSASSVG